MAADHDFVVREFVLANQLRAVCVEVACSWIVAPEDLVGHVDCSATAGCVEIDLEKTVCVIWSVARVEAAEGLRRDALVR